MSIQDTVEKFLEGDVIVDRRNPFKDGGDSDTHASFEGLNTIATPGAAIDKGAADDPKGPVETASIKPKGHSRQTTNKTKPRQVNKITKNQYNRKQHLHTKSKFLANCSNSLQSINNEIQKDNSKQFTNVSTPEDDDQITFLEQYPSVAQLQETSDAYASLIEILTMENKTKKRSSLKKIFPSIFSSHSKSSKNADKLSEASGGSTLKGESAGVAPGSPYQLKKAAADNAENGEENRYYFEERASPKQLNFLKKDNNDNSQSSSTSTLVSDGDNARNNFKAKIPVRKSSLKNELASNSLVGGYNNHFTSDRHDTPKAQTSQKIEQIVPPVRTTSIPVVKTNNELLIVEPSTSSPTQKYETKIFRPIIVKSSYFHPEPRDDKSKPSTFYYHDKKNPEYNNRNEFRSLDSYNSQPVSNVFADIISVGAEMKISTTNVAVSPKKESEVKQRKQLRARSLSPAECKMKNILQAKGTDGLDSSRNPTPAQSQVIVTPIDSCSNNDDSDNAIITEEQYAQTEKRNSELRSKSNPIIQNEMKIYRPVILNPVPDKLKYDSNADSKLNNNVSNQLTKKSADSLIDIDYQKFNHNEMATSSPLKPINGKTSSVEYRHTKSPDNVPPEQKIKNLHNVEAFYWQQLKKIKQQQEEELLRQTISSNDMILNRYALQNNARSSSSDYVLGPVGQVPWRCRSVSPGFVRTSEQRSNSLPHFNDNPFSKPPTGIKEFTNKLDSGLVPIPLERKNIVNPNFVRGSSTRYTIGTTNDITVRKNPGRQIAQNYGSYTTHRGAGAGDRNLLLPIFKKGSLSVEPMKESTLVREKRVSFSNSQGSDASKLKSVYENLASSQMSGSLDPNLARPSRSQLQMFRIARPLDQTSSLPRGQYILPSVMHTYGKITKNRQSEGVYATIQNRGFDRSVPRRIPNVAYPSPASPPIEPKDSKLNSAAGVAKNLFFRRVNSARAGQHLTSVGQSESESGSEAGEVQRIMLGGKMSPGRAVFQPYQEEDWNPGGKNRGDGSVSEGGRGRLARRDDPRRHTLGGDLLRAAPPHSALVRGMDIEISPRGYAPPSSAMLFDDDPGIMSEVETASTGFRRGGKQRSSLPVVRTPSKTLERPLGLVFLQYRSETKRALLPNEITSIDTVKALFVRSFNKQLTMEYLDSPLVKIYIHDSSKDMFYELEDLRSHLRDIRDRSVLRLFESADVSGGAFPGTLGSAVALPPPGPSATGPSTWDQDQSYFSEPEFESDYHHQHIHKSKAAAKPPAYYMGNAAPSTLPRGGSAIRAYSPAGGPPIPADRMKPIPGPGAPPKPLRAYGSAASIARGGSERCFPLDAMRVPDQLYSLPADRIHNDGYMSSPERGSRGAYEEPYYTQYVGPPRGGMTPVIDEEVTGDHPSLLDDQFSLYGLRPAGRVPPYDGPRLNAHNEEVQQRMRVEHMERQLANLTGLVQKALQTPSAPPPREFMPVASHFRTTQGPVGVLKTSSSTTSLVESVDPFLRTDRPPKLGKGRYHKSVSFEKSVSFSDEPPDMNSPKQHSPQNSADTKPPKPAIKSSTLPRMSSQERDRLKPVPPPKPKALVTVTGVIPTGVVAIPSQPLEYFAHLRQLHRRCKEIRSEMRNLRRMTLAQAHTMRDLICDTFVKFKNATMSGGDFNFHEDSLRLAQEEEDYKQEMLKLEADLCDLENTVEHLRGSVIHSNRKTRVNMLDVERMALILSKSSKTVADLKVRFPSLHEGMKGMLGNEMEKVVREEKFLKEEPERLEMALRRCKKLTGTLVTLKRLASVQEQRLPCDGRMSPDLDDLELEDLHPHENTHNKSRVWMLTPEELRCRGGVAKGSDDVPQDPQPALLGSHRDKPSPLTTAAGESSYKGSGMRGVGEPGVAGGNVTPESAERSENALDALLDELQTFARPPEGDGEASEGEGEMVLLRRLRGPSSPEPSPAPGPRAAAAAKPPVPERNPELLQLAARRAPPPPPPRTSSRSPLASPAATYPVSPSNSSSCDSVDSQEGASRARAAVPRHDLLELRHQELLKKQKALQEQYARLQQIQRGGNSLTVVPPPDLKKTGSESNLVSRMGLSMSPAAPMSGSLTHLAGPRSAEAEAIEGDLPPLGTTTSKIYETDIL